MRKIGTGRRKKNTVNTMEKTKDPSECERNNSMYRSNLNFPSNTPCKIIRTDSDIAFLH